MPGENLHKLSKSELNQLRGIVRKVYGENEGFTPEQAKQYFTDYECDKLIDSLLPETVDKLQRIGVESKWVDSKVFLTPSGIVDINGNQILR